MDRTVTAVADGAVTVVAERTGAAMADRTVMVVEDDASIRDAVVEILAFAGFEPVVARNGAEALAALRRGRPSPAVILLDLMMPVMNGWQFRDEQLRDPAIASIPVVVMSASDLEGITADARVLKPFDIGSLLATIARLATGPDQRSDRELGAAASGTCRIATEFMQ